MTTLTTAEDPGTGLAQTPCRDGRSPLPLDLRSLPINELLAAEVRPSPADAAFVGTVWLRLPAERRPRLVCVDVRRLAGCAHA